MSQADAVIRRYEHEKDDKLVKFMVAKAAFEPLAIANRKATTQPLALSIWIAVSCIIVQVMDWWPDPRFGFLGYLRPLPIFAVFALPIMFFIDWYQRPQFEAISQETLKRRDMANVEEYYSQTPVSGLWIYDFGEEFVGLVAVDASTDALSDRITSSSASPSSQTAQDSDEFKSKLRSRSKGKGEGKKGEGVETGSTAVIRHLYVSEPYRVANAQDDLIAFATKRVFETPNSVDRVIVTPSPLFDYLGNSLKKAGFEVLERGEKIGIFGWTTLTYELTRQKWETRRQQDS